MAETRFSPLPGAKPRCGLSPGARTGLCVGVCNLVILGAAMIIPRAWPRKQSFSEIILLQCSGYTPPRNSELRVDKDCEKIAEEFTNAFISKDSCHVRAEDYQPLMQLVNQAIPRDKVLFWSKTEELTHHYKKAGGRLFLMREVLLGHVADILTWCRNQSSSGVNLDSCPKKDETCHDNAAGVFWNVSSKWFAENTSGKVHVLLNGSVSDTYSEISVFRSVEVPNLPSEVRALHAWVIYDRGVPVRNLCSGASIKQLELDLRPDIVFTCEDMDRETFLQCVENPEGSQCKSVV